MAGAGIQIEAIELLQFPDALQFGLMEGALSIEGMQNNAFQQVAESQIVIVGKGLQHFQEPLFHADPCLYAFDNVFSSRRHIAILVLIYHGNNIAYKPKNKGLRIVKNPAAADGFTTPKLGEQGSTILPSAGIFWIVYILIALAL